MQTCSEGASAVNSNQHIARSATQRSHGHASIVAHHTTKHATSQLQGRQQQQEPAACPVAVRGNLPAGKLYKHLLSQVLAALTTCRKLPPGHKHRQELDQLLQQAAALAHEVVAACSAAAVVQLEPQLRHYTPQPQLQQKQPQQQQQQQPPQQQQNQSAAPRQQALLPAKQQQQQSPQKLSNQHKSVIAADEKTAKHVTWNPQPTIRLIPASSATPSDMSCVTELEGSTLGDSTAEDTTSTSQTLHVASALFASNAQVAAPQTAPVADTTQAAAAAAVAESVTSKEQLATFVEAVDLGPLLEFSRASKWSRSMSSEETEDVQVHAERHNQHEILHEQRQQEQCTAHCSQQEENELQMFRRFSHSLGGCERVAECGDQFSGKQHAPEQVNVRRGSACRLPADSRRHSTEQTVCNGDGIKHSNLTAGAALQRQSSFSKEDQHERYVVQSSQALASLQVTEHQHGVQQQQHDRQLPTPLKLECQPQHAHKEEHDTTNALETVWSISSWYADNTASAMHGVCVDPEVQWLVQNLSSSDKLVQRAAANTLMNLAFSCPELRVVVASAGALVPLVRMLESTSRSCQVAAAGALSNLSVDNASNQAAIAELGGVQVLSNLLGSSNESVQRAAVRALNNLAWDENNRAVIATAGGIPQLVQLLSSDCADIQEHAAAALMNMGRDTLFGIPAAIAEAGGIPALVRLLHSNCTDDVRDTAAGALMNLAYGTPGNRAAIAAAGGIVPLITLLTSKNKNVQRTAAGALKNLSRDSFENQTAIAEAGGIPVLAWILKGSRDDVKMEAAGALWNLIYNNPENQDELAAAGGIEPLMDLMDKL